MPSPRLWRRVSAIATIVLFMEIGAGQIAHGQSTSAPAGDSNQSWTSTSETGNTSYSSNPARTTESHTESDGRTLDTQSLQIRGPGGRYEKYLDTEKETIKVNASTTRTIERVYARDLNGQKTLVEVTEQETRALPGNETKSVRTTSNSDVNGRLQITRREIQETRQSSPDVQDTKTTILTTSVNGGLAPSVQTEEHQTRRNEHLSEFRKSTSLLDGNGNWRVAEVRQGTITDSKDGNERTREENILRPDIQGRLSLVEKNVSHESKGASGDKSQTTETFSKEVPGGFGDGTMHVNKRETSVEHSRADGTKTREQQVEERNPGDPAAGLRPTEKTIDIARPSVTGGTQETRTIESRSINGDMSVVWVDTRQVSNIPSIQVDTKKGTAPSTPPNQSSPAPAR